MSSIGEMSEHTEKYLLLEDPRYLEQGLRVRATVERDLAALDALALSPPEREAADRLLRLWREGAPALQAEPGLDVANRLREELAAFLQISRAQMRHKAERRRLAGPARAQPGLGRDGGRDRSRRAALPGRRALGGGADAAAAARHARARARQLRLPRRRQGSARGDAAWPSTSTS